MNQCISRQNARSTVLTLIGSSISYNLSEYGKPSKIVCGNDFSVRIIKLWNSPKEAMMIRPSLESIKRSPDTFQCELNKFDLYSIIQSLCSLLCFRYRINNTNSGFCSTSNSHPVPQSRSQFNIRFHNYL